jgi:hypothetical protein
MLRSEGGEDKDEIRVLQVEMRSVTGEMVVVVIGGKREGRACTGSFLIFEGKCEFKD